MKDEVMGAEDRLELDSLFVRAFLVLGIVVWTAAALSALMTGLIQAFYAFGILALFTASVLIVGWYFERAAMTMLVAAVGVLVAWGFVVGWEAGIWVMMSVLLIVPLALAAGMFFFAEREEEVLEHAGYALPLRGVHA